MENAPPPPELLASRFAPFDLISLSLCVCVQEPRE